MITDEWLSGFIDGEGSIGIAGHGGSLQPRFRINQRDDDGDLVRAIREYIGLGTLHGKYDRKNINAKPQLAYCLVGSDCNALTAILDRAPLRSKKRFEYPHWKKAVEIYSNNLCNRWSGDLVARGAMLQPLKDKIEASRLYIGAR